MVRPCARESDGSGRAEAHEAHGRAPHVRGAGADSATAAARSKAGGSPKKTQLLKNKPPQSLQFARFVVKLINIRARRQFRPLNKILILAVGSRRIADFLA